MSFITTVFMSEFLLVLSGASSGPLSEKSQCNNCLLYTFLTDMPRRAMHGMQSLRAPVLTGPLLSRSPPRTSRRWMRAMSPRRSITSQQRLMKRPHAAVRIAVRPQPRGDGVRPVPCATRQYPPLSHPQGVGDRPRPGLGSVERASAWLHGADAGDKCVSSLPLSGVHSHAPPCVWPSCVHAGAWARGRWQTTP